MNKTAFTEELYRLLKPLSKAERRQHIDYYEEMIDDRMEDGLSEEEAVAALGSAADIAAQILGDVPPKPARKLSVWAIVLIVLGSPLWLSLLLGAVMVAAGIAAAILGVYIALWAVIVALYCGVAALAASVLAGITGGVYYLFRSVPTAGVLFFGGSLVCAGCGVLLFLLCNCLVRQLWRLSKWAVQKIAGIFRRKGGKK